MPLPPSDPTPQDSLPQWHTPALVALIVMVFAAGTVLTLRAPTSPVSDVISGTHSRITTVYAPLVVVQWGLVAYVARIGRPKSAFLELLGRRWTSVGRACADVACALGLWALILAVELAWQSGNGASSSGGSAPLLPSTELERIVWVAVALSVGIGEEIVYRGYLQTRFATLTGRASLGNLAQACLFGLAHAQQGAASVGRIAVFALAFGGLAQWRRSLIPGMICHVAVDLASGLHPLAT